MYTEKYFEGMYVKIILLCASVRCDLGGVATTPTPDININININKRKVHTAPTEGDNAMHPVHFPRCCCGEVGQREHAAADVVLLVCSLSRCLQTTTTVTTTTVNHTAPA